MTSINPNDVNDQNLGKAQNVEPLSFEDEIIQDELPQHVGLEFDDFQPWHRARKEFVRSNQWGKFAFRLIRKYWRELESSSSSAGSVRGSQSRMGAPSGNFFDPLKCLVIPGRDLLDVRALWRDINSLGCSIRFLGFNEGEGSDKTGTRIHVNHNSVLRLPGIFPDSYVAQDRFEEIGKINSIAYTRLKDYGPFHIVNLDLCGSIFPNTAQSTVEYYEAITNLLAFQFYNQRKAWLLFVTTMVEPGLVDSVDFKKICGPVRENYDNFPDFAREVTKLIPIEAFPDSPREINFSNLSEKQMTELFGVAFGKWLLHLSQSARPRWELKMKPSYMYTINEEKKAVMLSLAFQFRPEILPPVDSTGITNLRPAPRVVSGERECALSIAAFVSQIRDVDMIFDKNLELKEIMRKQNADLLETANYDKKKYFKWEKEFENN